MEAFVFIFLLNTCDIPPHTHTCPELCLILKEKMESKLFLCPKESPEALWGDTR